MIFVFIPKTQVCPGTPGNEHWRSRAKACLHNHLSYEHSGLKPTYSI